MRMRRFTVGTVKKSIAAISPMEPRALHRPLEDRYLLAQRQVLRSECRAVLEQQPEEARDDL